MLTGHVGINVTSLDRSHDFYTEIYAKDGASGKAPVSSAPTCGFF